jgi:hypothetical protein
MRLGLGVLCVMVYANNGVGAASAKLALWPEYAAVARQVGFVYDSPPPGVSDRSPVWVVLLTGELPGPSDGAAAIPGGSAHPSPKAWRWTYGVVVADNPTASWAGGQEGTGSSELHSGPERPERGRLLSRATS